jgi:ATP-dependent helicase/DNAse subunit B
MYEWNIRDHRRDMCHQGYSFEISSAEPRPIAIEKSPLVMDRVKKMTYSATSLLTYLTCSLKFYLTYILRVRESEEMMESPDDRLLGTIVHDILHRCYSPYIGKTVTDEILNRMENESFYDPLILDVMKKKLGISDVQTGRNRVVFEVIKDFLNHFFRYEQNNSGFSIRGLEKSIDGLDFKMMHDKSELNVKLKGTIDRWDEMDGIFRIIDYKTGDIKSQNIQSFEVFRGIKVVDRRSAFQLFFYGLLLQKHQPLCPVSRLGVFSLRKPDDPLNFVSIEKREDLTEKDFRDFEAFLMAVFQEIFDPSVTFSQTPHEILCRNCPFQSQCDRIQPDFG